MQPYYIFIGGNSDGLNYPSVTPAPERLQLAVGVAGRETYNRLTLSLGDASITVYVHESLAPEQALDLLVEHYRAWCFSRPGGRRNL